MHRYLDTIPKVMEQVHPYSCQRRNPTEVQKAALSEKLKQLAKEENVQVRTKA